MDVREEIRKVVAAIPAEMSEKKGIFGFSVTVAERRTLLNRQKLVYGARFRIDEEKKEVIYSEMLREKGFGLGIGGGADGTGPGYGFKKSVYKTGMGPREENIEEQSSLFGKKYNYTFDFGGIRKRIQAAATAAGYVFTYRLGL